MSLLSRAVRVVAGAAAGAIRQQRRAPQHPRQPAPGVREFSGPLPALRYAPHADGRPDPGEVVWAWVPYDENNGQGKDRPVLIIGEHAGGLLGLQLTSTDHDRDAEQEARWGRYWVDVGSGDWDGQRRPSEARLDRVLWLSDDAVRREGAALERSRFDEVLAALRDRRHGD